MIQQKRTYLQMQLEEATLASGRYNADYEQANPAPSAANTLVQAYRKAMASVGAPLRGQPTAETTAANPANNT